MAEIDRLKKEKNDEEELLNPFQGLKKGSVLQNVRMFSSPKLDIKESYFLLTKILFILHGQGESFTQDEATTVFIAVTKLFQCQDPGLRRMMYLLLKELGPKAEENIMAFASLVKDVNGENEINKANSIRVISGLMDSKLLSQTMERFLKQAIVDKDPYVATAGLVAGSHLALHSMDIVKRWTSEIQESMNSQSIMVQYHAMGLLYQIKSKDRLAVTKLVKTYSKETLRSPLGHCILVQYAAQILEDLGEFDKDIFSYLENSLRNRNEIVAYEAARCICDLPFVTSKEISSAILVLQSLLASSKTTARYAAVKTLNKVANKFPASITSSCTSEMDSLISDVNKTVATLAITILLKVESENNVEKLMNKISSFIADIGDEDKLVVVDGIIALSSKYPAKYHTIMNYLSMMLRGEGGKDYKSTIIDGILGIMEKVQESKESGLDYLCEYIEDCEFTPLATRVLSLIGDEGPQMRNPGRYIRCIYNRIVLENEIVRASAVAALAKFGLKNVALREKITTLLKRSIHDNDDEVRDRATFYLHMLSSLEDADKLIVSTLGVPLVNLEAELIKYLESPTEVPFNISNVSTVTKSIPQPQSKNTGSSSKSTTSTTTENVRENDDISSDDRIRKLNLGPLLNTSSPVEITEKEAAFPVSVTKHLYSKVIVLQFSVKNTVSDNLLKNISVEIGIKSNKFIVREIFPLEVLEFDDIGQIYVVVQRQNCTQGEEIHLHSAAFGVNLLYTVHEVDSTGEVDEEGYPDEARLDNVEIGLTSYIRKVNLSNFAGSWDSSEYEHKSTATFKKPALSNLQQATKEMINFLGFQPCDGSEVVQPGATKHILYLSGRFMDADNNGVNVIARIRMRYVPEQGVLLELVVGSRLAELSAALSGAIFA